MDQNYTPTPAPQTNDTKALVFGILSLAFAGSGLFGIIFGAIAKKNAGAAPEGKAKIGKILGTIGLILGILGIVAWVIFGIVYGATLATLMTL